MAKVREELAQKSKVIETLEERLASKELAMTRQSEVIAQMSLTHAKQAQTIQEMARMNCQSKGSNGSGNSFHRKTRSHSPSSNQLYQSRNHVNLFGSSVYMPSDSSIGYGHPMSRHSQSQKHIQLQLLEDQDQKNSPDFAESVKRAQSIEGKL